MVRIHSQHPVSGTVVTFSWIMAMTSSATARGIRRELRLVLMPATIGYFRFLVNRFLLVSSGYFHYYFHPMAAETMDDLLDAVGLSIAVIEKRAEMSARTILAMRKGETVRPRVATVARLAKVLGVPVARVRAAIEASRKR